MKWLFIAVLLLFTFGTIGEKDKERSMVYASIVALSLVLIYLVR